MAPLPDNADYEAGETFGYVPIHWSDAGNREYNDRGHRSEDVPQGLPEAPAEVRHLKM
ncbi:unnamed protein product [Protopolystoma xenopodis]|uniref:Uncharacterized protein n=1 Tax=Protopolystoma xenopodis TaxID=117903 RepID=A0A3S5C0D5_9PLAT|nr:unnamed protein product [Protopolystoma xenopodis]